MTSHNLHQQVDGSETVMISSADQEAMRHLLTGGPDSTVLLPAGVVNNLHLQQEQKAWQDLRMVGLDRTIPNGDTPLSPEVFHRQERIGKIIRRTAGVLLGLAGLSGAGLVVSHNLELPDRPNLGSNPAAVAGDYTNQPAGSATALGSPESPTTIVIEHGPESSEAPKISGDTPPPTAPSTEAAPDSTFEVADSTTASSASSTTEAPTTGPVETTPASPTTITAPATTAAPTTSRPPSTTPATTAPSSSTPSTTETTKPPQTTETTRAVTVTSAPPPPPQTIEAPPTTKPPDVTIDRITLRPVPTT